MRSAITAGWCFNWLFDSSVVAYSPDFEESQHFSDTFSTFARDLAKEIAARCGLTADSHVIEIGCGKGEFLAELSRISGCEGIGIDPAFRDDPHRGNRTDRLSFITEWVGPQHFDLPCDVVLCRHTLEHIGPVAEFVKSIRNLTGDREAIRVVFETPSVHRILEEGAFWDVYYEHVSYFTEASHAWLFRHCGFKVIESKRVFSDQYIVQYARPSTRGAAGTHHVGSIVEQARLFAGRALANQRHWQQDDRRGDCIRSSGRDLGRRLQGRRLPVGAVAACGRHPGR